MILVDSNIPMYLVGAPHAHKSDARRLLEKVVSERQSLITDAEVLQEILHRYVAIDRRDAIQPAFDALIGIVDQVLAVDRSIAERGGPFLYFCILFPSTTTNFCHRTTPSESMLALKSITALR